MTEPRQVARIEESDNTMRAEIATLRARCAELERWKAEANHVIDAVQRAYKIAGDSAVIGDDIDDTVARMRAQLDERTREARDSHVAFEVARKLVDEVIAERDAALETIERIRAVCDGASLHVAAGYTGAPQESVVCVSHIERALDGGES